MGCGASTSGDSGGKMTSVAPGSSNNNNNNGTPQKKDTGSGSEQAAVTALTMKRRNNNIRGTKGYNQENNTAAPDMTPVDKSDDIRDRLQSALTKHWLFESSTSDQIVDIVSVMRPKVFTDGENIITQGDEKAGEFFFVSSGSCAVEVDGKVLEHTVETNQCFGELALFYQCPRTATIKAAGGDVETWILDQAVFRYALASRNEEMLKEHVTFLKQMPTFQDTPDRNLKKLAEALGRMTFDDGDYIVKQGDIGEVFYIVVKGEAKVIENGVEKDHTMNKGDWFGERSLLTHEVRSASIVAKGALECVAVSKQDFDSYFGSFEAFRSMKKGNLVRTLSSMKKEQTVVKKMQMDELKLLTVLGVGGFGLVSLVQNKANGEAYALKKMQKERIVEAQMQDMIVNEKKFLSEMNSPVSYKVIKVIYYIRDHLCPSVCFGFVLS
jgi:CRP-like cAMP-binding protein